MFLIAAMLLFAGNASAQKYPERRLVRKGNKAFAAENYEKAAERYARAAEATPGCFEAIYNLGNALASAGMNDKAEEALRAAAADSLRADDERAEAFFNLGNVQLAQQKLREALESYKNSLRMNPADVEAKYNYVYVKRLLENQQDDGGGGDSDQNSDEQNQNEGGDENRDGSPEQNDDNDGDKQDDGSPEQGENDSDEGQDDRDGQASAEPRISEGERDRLLEAVQAEEDKTQDKLKEKEKGVLIRGRKNW